MTRKIFVSSRMFVRRKKNRSGSTTVVVISKLHGSFKEVHNLGTSSDPDVIERMENEARKWIDTSGGLQQPLDLWPEERKLRPDEIFDSIAAINQDGAYRLLERIYDSIGFNQVGDTILKDLAIARICEPMSKLATVDYIRRHWRNDYHYQQVYRYLDELHNTHKDTVLRISVEHTREILGGVMAVAFYDVTTLYFESFKEDNLRNPGFSKDGKTAETQVVLGLLVSRDGYPLAYSLFNGSQFEGRTMIPIVDDFIQRYSISDFVLVADAGLMTDKNLNLLRQGGYRYIIGGRIKKEAKTTQEWILGLGKDEGVLHEMRKINGDRLIVSYSQKRADKDAFNRDRGVRRLQKSYASGRITKDKINKRGYNKFLTISKDVEVVINKEKIEEDAKWDGLKGYITNTDLDAHEVIAQYHGLWVVERAFRIMKGTLDTRPMFHFTERRIEAHVCLCFVALKTYKEFERILKSMSFDLSVDKTLDIAKTISSLTIKLPDGQLKTQMLYLTDEQRRLKTLYEMLDIAP